MAVSVPCHSTSSTGCVSGRDPIAEQLPLIQKLHTSVPLGGMPSSGQCHLEARTSWFTTETYRLAQEYFFPTGLLSIAASLEADCIFLPLSWFTVTTSCLAVCACGNKAESRNLVSIQCHLFQMFSNGDFPGSYCGHSNTDVDTVIEMPLLH